MGICTEMGACLGAIQFKSWFLHVLVLSVFGQMLSVGVICFEDRCRKGGTGGGGWVHRSGLQCIAAVAAACRKALVDIGWAICLQ